MTMNEIKKVLGTQSLNFKAELSPDGTETGWNRAWINSSRTAVLIHDTLAETITEDTNTLSLKDMGTLVSNNSGEVYHVYCIIQYSNVKYSF